MKIWHPGWFLLSGSLLVTLIQPALSQTVTANTRDQIVQAVKQAKPGTTILIAPGTYQGGLSFNGLRGKAGRPIILAAAEKADPPSRPNPTVAVRRTRRRRRNAAPCR